MFELPVDDTLRVFAGCCVVLCLALAGLAFATPILRAKRNVWLNEEDAKRFDGSVADVEQADVARLIRVHRNQLENFVPFFALGALWIAVGGAGGLGVPLFVAFTVARVTHALFFLLRMGRARTAAHTVSWLALLVLSVGLAARALA